MGDPAIDVDEATALRLVEEKGVAEYVTPPAQEQVADADVERAEAEKSIEDMTAKELRQLGAEYGLTFKGNASKSDMIEAIKAEWPVDEDAPTFDAAEAVQ